MLVVQAIAADIHDGGEGDLDLEVGRGDAGDAVVGLVSESADD